MSATAPPTSVPDPVLSESLYPVIIATIVLCSVLTSIAVAARLITKYLVASFGVEDCENPWLSVTYTDNEDKDLLIAAWVLFIK